MEAQYELCYNDRNVRDRGIVARRIALLCEQGRIAVKRENLVNSGRYR